MNMYSPALARLIYSPKVALLASRLALAVAHRGEVVVAGSVQFPPWRQGGPAGAAAAAGRGLIAAGADFGVGGPRIGDEGEHASHSLRIATTITVLACAHASSPSELFCYACPVALRR